MIKHVDFYIYTLIKFLEREKLLKEYVKEWCTYHKKTLSLDLIKIEWRIKLNHIISSRLESGNCDKDYTAYHYGLEYGFGETFISFVFACSLKGYTFWWNKNMAFFKYFQEQFKTTIDGNS